MDTDALLAFYKKLDRSVFLSGDLKSYAGADNPLPIGYGQTISQPSLVLEMTRLLNPEKNSRVLEIGTGSGYQTALLSEFSGHVVTVERVPELSAQAKKRLDGLGYQNITYLVGDGSKGSMENAPFDRIMVTAAAAEVPPELIAQLKPLGRLVIPVGPEGRQELLLITKDKDGTLRHKTVDYVRFVELVGDYGWH